MGRTCNVSGGKQMNSGAFLSFFDVLSRARKKQTLLDNYKIEPFSSHQNHTHQARHWSIHRSITLNCALSLHALPFHIFHTHCTFHFLTSLKFLEGCILSVFIKPSPDAQLINHWSGQASPLKIANRTLFRVLAPQPLMHKLPNPLVPHLNAKFEHSTTKQNPKSHRRRTGTVDGHNSTAGLKTSSDAHNALRRPRSKPC